MDLTKLTEFFHFSNELFVLLENQKIREVNRKFCEVVGAERDDLLGKSPNDLILSHDIIEWEAAVSNALLSPKQNIEIDVRILNSKKKARMISWILRNDGDGTILVKGEDITEKLKQKDRFQRYSFLLTNVNESLEKTSHRLFMLQDALASSIPNDPNSLTKILNVGKNIFDMDFGFIGVYNNNNEDELEVIACDAENSKFLGSICKEIELTNNFVDFDETAEIGINGIGKLQFVSYKEASDYVFKSTIGYPVFGSGRKIIGVVKFLSKGALSHSNFDNNEIQFLKLFSDNLGRVLELQEINRRLQDYSMELEQKNRELDEFSYIVSHDLKAPLRAISNLAEFIIEDLGDPEMEEEVKENAALLNGRVNRMGALITGVLEYSRVGREQAEQTKFESYDVIKEVCDDLIHMNEKAHFDFKNEFPKLELQSLYFNQVVSNLVSNAIKYNDKEHPLIKISSEQKGMFYQFTVEDNGPGIPEEFRERVFRVFETLQPRDQVEGTGIGLTIVLKMIKLMGGKIWIEDSELGGAAFHFTVPSMKDSNLIR